MWARRIEATALAMAQPAVSVKTVHAKIGELTLEREQFFGGRAQQVGVSQRKAMIDREPDLPSTRGRRRQKRLAICGRPVNLI
jgi:hypothetical protein